MELPALASMCWHCSKGWGSPSRLSQACPQVKGWWTGRGDTGTSSKEGPGELHLHGWLVIRQHWSLCPTPSSEGILTTSLVPIRAKSWQARAVFPTGGPCPPQALKHLLHGLRHNEGLFAAGGSFIRALISSAGCSRGSRLAAHCSAAKVWDAYRCNAQKRGWPGADSCPCSGGCVLVDGQVSYWQPGLGEDLQHNF